MPISYYYLFLLSISLTTCALFEDDSILKAIPSMKYFKGLKEGNSDHLVMLFFYGKNCPACNAIKS